MKNNRTWSLAVCLVICAGLIAACATQPSWAQRPVVKQLKGTNNQQLNIGFMLRGYFYAYAKTSRGLGGNAISRNLPVKIRTRTAKSGLFLTVRTTSKLFAKKYQAIEVTLGNTTGKMMHFRAQDSRLYIVQEALDKNGQWRPVEYLPRSWCGNSYHTLGLPDGYQWRFVAPRYHGSLRTKLRIKLRSKNQLLVSKSFYGSINPAQFTTRKKYHPRNIMDPYNN